MKAATPLVAVLLLTACAQTPGASALSGASPASTAGTPTALATTALSSPDTANPTTERPSPSAISPPISVSSFTATCRLPVTWTVVNGNQAFGTAGFLQFPNGALAADSSAPAGSYFFDRGFSRWLPVAREAVSSDGKRYAYTDGSAYQGTGHIHLVDLTTNTDRVIYTGAFYRVVDFEPEGIYLTSVVPEGPALGLWLESPSGGSPRLINSSYQNPSVGGGAGWSEDFNPADTHPAPGGIAGARNQIERIDLSTGAMAPWFWRAGAYVTVAGFDTTGRPLIRVDAPAPNDPDVNDDTIELWLALSPTSATRLFSGLYKYDWPTSVSALDGYGVWFDGSKRSIWIYSNQAIRIVAQTNLGQLHVAGGCISST